MNADLIFNAHAKLGEGAIWNAIDKKLYWVDIEGMLFDVYDPATGENTSYPTGKLVGTAIPAVPDRVLLALEDGIGTLDLTNGIIAYEINTAIHHENKRFNDGKCDPSGRFWVGSLTKGEASDNNKLYTVDSNFIMTEKIEGLTISNGIAWSLDHSLMYHIDTPTGEITSYDFNVKTGDIKNRKVVITIPAETGYPDGMTIDCEGMLWIALWDGYCVARYNPNTGAMLKIIEVAAPKVTSCAFGGPDLSQLYITTATSEMTDAELTSYPLSGGLFVADVGVNGINSFHFNQLLPDTLFCLFAITTYLLIFSQLTVDYILIFTNFIRKFWDKKN